MLSKVCWGYDEQVNLYLFFKILSKSPHLTIVSGYRKTNHRCSSSLASVLIYLSIFLQVPISGSLHSIHLKEWLKVFPKKQLFITRTEDFADSVANTLLNIFRYLKLGTYSPG